MDSWSAIVGNARFDGTGCDNPDNDPNGLWCQSNEGEGCALPGGQGIAKTCEYFRIRTRAPCCSLLIELVLIEPVLIECVLIECVFELQGGFTARQNYAVCLLGRRSSFAGNAPTPATGQGLGCGRFYPTV